jgi:hypothetical protein
MRQGCTPPQVLFNIVFEFLGIAVRQEEGIQERKKEVELSLFVVFVYMTYIFVIEEYRSLSLSL